jgi:CRISPR-associated protein Cmr6
MDYPIPKATVAALIAQRGKPPQNPGLLFDRLAPDWGRQATLKKDGLDAVRIAAERADSSLLQSIYARWLAAARWGHAEPFTLQTDWRFVAGLGRKGPLEVGFSFSRCGFPTLPGSSVKGIARAYALLVEGLDADSPDFVAIFGRTLEGETEEMMQAGGAIYFDAIPVRAPKLELDVMNPHYPDYYQHKKPPTAWQSPIPVYFLTVVPGTEFAFAVGWRTELDETGSRLLVLARQWLEGGLKELGAGAKTTAGYGFFEEASKATQPITSPNTSGRPAIEQEKSEPPRPRVSGNGKVRYEGGRPVIVDAVDVNLKLRVDWKVLRMESLAERTLVNYEYEELPDGRRRVVKVTRSKP